MAVKENLFPANLGSQLDAFDAELRELRNVREHYDEYIDGKKKNSVRSHTFEDGSIFSADAKWSVQVGAEEMLGCRLNVTHVAKALGQSREELEEAGLWILSHRAVQLANESLKAVKKD